MPPWCSLPTDHTQVGSVRTESSVGLEKPTALRARFLQPGSRLAAGPAGSNLLVADAAGTGHWKPTQQTRLTMLGRVWEVLTLDGDRELVDRPVLLVKMVCVLIGPDSWLQGLNVTYVVFYLIPFETRVQTR